MNYLIVKMIRGPSLHRNVHLKILYTLSILQSTLSIQHFYGVGGIRKLIPFYSYWTTFLNSTDFELLPEAIISKAGDVFSAQHT